MPTETPCEEVEARLVEALLARTQPTAQDCAHAAACPSCGPALDELRTLRRALDAAAEPEPRPALLAAAWRGAVAELERARAAPAPAKAPIQGVPLGFHRELGRLLGGALAPLPLVLLWNVALLALGQRLLAGWVPAPVLSMLAVGYVLAAAGWIALLYGSIPLVAHRRVQRRLPEVST
jgi:hypothetical protein